MLRCSLCYGDLASRGVKGVVLEAFGVGNIPDEPKHGWLPWLKDQRRKGLQVRQWQLWDGIAHCCVGWHVKQL